MVGTVYRRFCHRAILLHAVLKKMDFQILTFPSLSMEIAGGLTRVDLGHAFLKIFILRFCHLPMKLDPLNPKMALVFYFGHPGSRGRHLQIRKLGFCSFATSPLAPLAYLTKIPGDPGRPVQATPVQARPVEPVAKTENRLFRKGYD